MSLELEVMRWYKIGVSGDLVSNHGSKCKDISDNPIRVLFLEHETDELANTFKDRAHLLRG